MKKLLTSLVIAVTMSLPAMSKHIVVNLSQQRACAYEGGRAVFCGRISSGKPGHRTPTGSFRVLEKDIDHRSSKYPAPHGGARMYYMLRITGYGVAMHLGHVPNYPASHGCIRMQNGFAQRMYRWANVGTPVRVVGSPGFRASRSLGFGYSHGSYGSSNDVISSLMGRHHSGHASKRSHHRRHVKRSSRRRYREAKRGSRHPHPLKSMGTI